MTRLVHLDWLRGVAVLVMVEAHTFDAWTRLDERTTPGYGLAIDIGGLGAPAFLFLAGVALVLAAGARLARGQSEAAAAAFARRRGWQILGLAFLFRLQSWLISGGDPSRTLLKVDILNIMGLSMLAAAVLWRAAGSRGGRAAWLTAAALGTVSITPWVRGTSLFAILPDQLEWYLREEAGVTSFALFPWAGFLFAGAVAGLVLEGARTEHEQRRANSWLGAAGLAMVLLGYASLGLSAAYRGAWEDWPPSFFLRLGAVMTTLPLALAWCQRLRGRSWIRDFGVASLFVYWIHVEMVYGVVASPFHRSLSFEAALGGYLILLVFLYLLVRLKDRLVRRWSEPAGTTRLPPGIRPARTGRWTVGVSR
jgi:uncharacterized membrane protein